MSALSDISIRELCTGDYIARRTVPVEWDDDGNVTVVKSILRDIDNNGQPMIDPYSPHLVREDDEGNRIISYGQSSYGYDVRLSDEFRLFCKPNDGRVIDPKHSNHDDFSVEFVAKKVVIPPGGLLLGRTLERFRIPRNIVVQCLGKSTYARVGALVNVTPLEPEWEGHLVIEITNGTNLPLTIYAYEGIAQLLFHEGDRPCEVSYGDRGGKYQGQTGVTPARM